MEVNSKIKYKGEQMNLTLHEINEHKQVKFFFKKMLNTLCEIIDVLIQTKIKKNFKVILTLT